MIFLVTGNNFVLAFMAVGGAQSAFICTVLPESTIYFQPSNKLQYLWKPTTRQFLEVFMILSFQILIF